ncbi:UDP-N-acetylglucosamine transferase subunit ALG13 homolog [Paramacrobiotus metropolitanus]|uniref:UDP-N-acetylglucosamine transferase subunit ALG13 homolog n=1 Tax=Paramacrobiotus metropolitanus TaxID=2943436 RepID=UPI00244585F9|nr:UDP-N-acetylglucosamine transferase subunit ALG13 homolog [Paramacrobiotus metropolitanus]
MAEPGQLVFVTVGTTSFDELVEMIIRDECLRILHAHGYSRLRIQYGRGRVDPPAGLRCGVRIESYRYKDSIRQDLLDADVVISHAGAGSIMESLGLHKRLLVVINETLMGNHQTELAEEFAQEQFLHWSTVRNLPNVLNALNFSTIKHCEPGTPQKFAQFMDDFLQI